MIYHADANNEPAKEVRSWNGIPLNITTRTGEPRFSFTPPMSCDYGCIRGSWGAGLDGKALDVYVVSDAPTVFKVVQITPAGAIDEYKYVLGAQNFDEAVETFLKHVPKQLFGAASQYSIAQLQNDIAQQSKVKRDANELTDFVEQLEALIEGDDAYDSNIYVLSFEVADNGDITGKFEDAWNGRIFTYSVQKTRIGYKPALALDRADSAAAKLFDLFSAGYTSPNVREDAIKNGKKPRCTAVSYSCGKICLSLQNTCWINSAGQKVKKAGGAVASISQGRIDKLRTLARYLAANGNNKWSKYGRAETLTAKANNLEKTRTNLFKQNIEKQSSNKLLAIQPTNKHTEPIEPSPNASDQEWKNFETAHKLWLENGDDSPYNKIQYNGRSIEQQKKEKIIEQQNRELESIKILPISIRRHLERTAYNEIAKSKGSIVYSGYNNTLDKKDAEATKDFLKSKLTTKQKEAVQVYTKIAKLKAYQEYENIHAKGTNIPKQVLILEDKLKKQKFESLVAFNSKGEQIVFLDGEQYSVEIPEQMIPQLQNTIITHNHPMGLGYTEEDPRHLGNSFSIEDIDLLYTAASAEIRAVSPGYRHSMKPPKDGWKFKSRDEIVNALLTIEAGVKKDFQARVNSGDLNYKDAEVNHQHEIMTRFSKQYETIYERIYYKRYENE